MLAVAMLAVAAAAAAAAAPAPAGVQSRYVVVERTAGGAVRPVWQTRVRLAAPAAGTEKAAVARPDGDGVVATVRAVGGRGVATQTVRAPRWLRGEFALPGGGGEIEGFLAPLESSHLVVRVPDGDGLALELAAAGLFAVAVPDPTPGDIAAELEALRNPATVLRIRSTGSPANRLDVVIVGEGYTEAQAEVFRCDAAAFADALLVVSPFVEYAPFMNVAALFVPSPEAGADHPPYRSDCAAGDSTCCADAAAQSDPRAGSWAVTAFDAAFCTLGIHRLLTVNVPRVLAAAAAAPDWDVLLVLVNDPVYGGSGGPVSVTSLDERAPEIARHELGHSFAELADEYEAPFPGYPGCSDLAGPGTCEVNVTDVIERAALKWSPWVLPDTPLPTPAEDPAFAALVGLFEGARYREVGMFRPRHTCLMRQLERPLCEVCREAFVQRLYRGGWGVPAAGIDPIEPGSEVPPPGSVTLAVGATLDLEVGLVAPATDPALVVSWRAGGAALPHAGDGRLTWTPPGPGVFRVELEVRDATGFVHPANAAALVGRRAWEVSVPSGRPPRRHVGRGE
jgi:hypothetical protein